MTDDDPTTDRAGDRRAGRLGDRTVAGRLLGQRLGARRPGTLVAGLPRGGAVVAAEVARALGAPLDVVVVRKLGVPWQPELAFGAVGEDGVRVLVPDVVAHVPAEQVEEVTTRERAEVARRARLWRGGRPHQVTGRDVVLVDDGIATGATAEAAVRVVRARGAAHLVLAVPVVARGTAERLRGLVDELVTLHEPTALGSVGCWYDDFTQVDDDTVRALLSGQDR